MERDRDLGAPTHVLLKCVCGAKWGVELRAKEHECRICGAVWDVSSLGGASGGGPKLLRGGMMNLEGLSEAGGKTGGSGAEEKTGGSGRGCEDDWGILARLIGALPGRRSVLEFDSGLGGSGWRLTVEEKGSGIDLRPQGTLDDRSDRERNSIDLGRLEEPIRGACESMIRSMMRSVDRVGRSKRTVDEMLGRIARLREGVDGGGREDGGAEGWGRSDLELRLEQVRLQEVGRDLDALGVELDATVGWLERSLSSPGGPGRSGGRGAVGGVE